jgi:hypothetical protein
MLLHGRDLVRDGAGPSPVGLSRDEAEQLLAHVEQA